MGRWDRRYRPRPRRRDYQDYQWSPPRDEPCPDPETEEWEDNVPMWEKKFCYLVGRMPWKKVLSRKLFMQLYSNIVDWDDSAAKEAFDNAKKRFWEEINGLPSVSEPPNPDLYIDQIDWNPYIDPDLVGDLDRSLFDSDDEFYSEHIFFKQPSEHTLSANICCPEDDRNPWECSQRNTSEPTDKAKENATGWNQWDTWPDDGKNTNHQEHGCDQGSANKGKATTSNQWDSWVDGGKTTWECGDNTGWKQWDSSVNAKDDNPWNSHKKDSEVARNTSWSNASKNWTSGGFNSWRNEGNKWHDRATGSRNWNPKTSEFQKHDYPNSNFRHRDYGSHHRGRGSYGRVKWVQKRWDNSGDNKNNNDWDVRESANIPRGRGQFFNAGCRKREGSDYHAVNNHKGPKLQGGDSHASRYWNEGGNNKRLDYGRQGS